MILPGDTYPAIDIIKLVQFIVAKETGEQVSIGNFQIVDVNPWVDYLAEKIVGAEHYDVHRLSRIHYETDLLSRCRRTDTSLIIYGQGADRATAVLSERGFRAILLTGNIKFFKESFPDGLMAPKHSSYDIGALKEMLERKANAKRGERLWRSTSASRMRSADTRRVRARAQTPVRTRKPWK